MLSNGEKTSDFSNKDTLVISRSNSKNDNHRAKFSLFEKEAMEGIYQEKSSSLTASKGKKFTFNINQQIIIIAITFSFIC